MGLHWDVSQRTASPWHCASNLHQLPQTKSFPGSQGGSRWRSKQPGETWRHYSSGLMAQSTSKDLLWPWLFATLLCLLVFFFYFDFLFWNMVWLFDLLLHFFYFPAWCSLYFLVCFASWQTQVKELHHLWVLWITQSPLKPRASISALWKCLPKG